VLLAGLIQYGMLFHAMITCDQYAREGARYTAEYWAAPAFNSTSTSSSGTFPNFMNGVTTSSNIPYSQITTWVYLPWNTTTNTYDVTQPLTKISNSTCTSSCVTISPGNVFTVEVQYDLTQQYVFFPFLLGLQKPNTFTAKAAMVAQ
jgi:hypothetical protein